MPDKNNRKFVFPDGSTVELWCDGREYDPSTESYHPKYSYKINWEDNEYTGNDIRDGANATPNASRGIQSLFAFLYACQEGMPQVTYGERDNSTLFPEHVREWAYQNSDEISTYMFDLEQENA